MATETATAPKTNNRLKPAEKELLFQIATGTQDNPYIVPNRDSKELARLAALDYILTNKVASREVSPGVFNIPAVLSPTGQAKFDSYPKEPANPRPTVTADDFTIEDDVPPPPARQRATGTVYPFDRLNVNQSFFIPPTPGSTADPVTSKQSAVTAANKREREAFEARKAAGGVAEGETAKRFRIAADTKDGVNGARVWRVE